MNGNEIIELIQKDESLRQINVNNINLNQFKPVFILCQNSIEKYPNINIMKLVRKQIPPYEIDFINSSPIRLDFLPEEINTFIKNKKDVFIANDTFLKKIGINPFALLETNIFFYKDILKRILYFKDVNKIFIIEKRNEINTLNNNININEIAQNNNININIMNNIINQENQQNNSANNILDYNQLNQLPTENNNEINILMGNNINEIIPQYNFENNNIKDNQGIQINPQILQKLVLNCLILLYANKKEIERLWSYNGNDKNTINKYTLVNKIWIETFKKEFHYPDIMTILAQNYQYETYNDYKNYISSFGNVPDFQNIIQKINRIPDKLSGEIKIVPNKKKYSNIIYPENFELVIDSLFEKLKNFIINKNEVNIYQFEYNIFIGNKTIYLQSKTNPNYYYVYIYDDKDNKYILLAFIFLKNIQIFKDLFNKHLINKTFDQYISEKNFDKNKLNQIQIIKNSNNVQIGQLLLMHQINQIGQLNNNFTNINIKENKEEQKNELNSNLIFKQFHEFINIRLPSLKDGFIDINNTNNIDNDILLNNLNYLGVFLIENKKLEYCLKILNYQYFSLMEKSNNPIEKQELLKKIKTPDFNSIISNLEIISQDKVIPGKIYSFVDENFCKDIKLETDKYKPFEGLLFKNKGIHLLYFQNKKNLLKLNHLNNNANMFTLSKILFKEPGHAKGLENIGATCYMNATLQCLNHVKSFKEFFQDKEGINKEINNKELSSSFKELINKLWENSPETYYAPTHFKNLISTLNPLFQGIQANDSKDLIIFIYETLHNELNNPNSNNDNLNNLNNNNISQDLRLFRQNYYSQNNSIITKIFYFEQSSNLQCLSCNVNKISYNIINFLIFPLEKVRLYLTKIKPQGFMNVTLEDCFEQNEEKELLNGPNQIYCNNCHRQSNAYSYNKINTCPEVLTIILNRGKGLEFDVEFRFPMKINIEKYVIEKNCDTNYELIGVITHLGPSNMGGHFIAYCKSPNDYKWYCYNDAQVNECTNVESEINSRGIPYVLYYQRINNKVSYQKESTEVGPEDNNNKDKFILYVKSGDKEGYIDINGDGEMLCGVIDELKKRYSWIPIDGIALNLNHNNLNIYQTIKENGLKNGDKIIIA